MNNTAFFIDALGWAGAGIVLIAYGLLSMQWMNGNSISYQTLNITGAFLLVVNSYYLGAYPSVGVNAAWVAIAIITLFFDWWRGPVAVYKKVTTNISKRGNIRKIALQRIKLPAFKTKKQNSLPGQPLNVLTQPHFSQFQRSE